MPLLLVGCRCFFFYGVIKKYGIFKHDIGSMFAETVLKRGGSKDPNVLLSNFVEGIYRRFVVKAFGS